MHTVRHQRHTTPDGVRTYANLEGQEKKVDDSAGNDTDVNNIVARFARTGQLPTGLEGGQYADVTHLQGDLAEMIIKGKNAEKELQALNTQEKKKKADQAIQDGKDLARLRAAEIAAQATAKENSDESPNP